MTALNRLFLAACGLHVADQIGLVAVPILAALVFDASAETIGVLVACQSMAHLVGSLPFGVWVDKGRLKTLAILGAVISGIGSGGAALSVLAGSLVWFAVTVTVAGFGIVLFVLTVLSILPRIVPADRLASANGRMEIPRALASFAIPLLIGVTLTQETADLVFLVAALAGLIAVVVLLRLPGIDRPPSPGESIFKRIMGGGAFVMRNHLLMAISLCAVFWNFAFAALMVVMVPLLVEVYRLDPAVFGTSMGAFGLGMVAGTWLMQRFGSRIAPNLILLFGPACSMTAVLILFANPANGSTNVILGAFFLMAFGPSMWLIAQNSVRQLISPPALLGRVNAVIQTAIYGIRPIGALAGGAVVGASSPSGGLAMVVVAFALSLAVALFSGLRSVRTYGSLSPVTGG